MYCISKIHIDKNHPAYDYCSLQCHCANNMENTALYLMRQVMTGIQKEESQRQSNEKEVLQAISNALPYMKEGTEFPTAEHWWLSYDFIDSFLKITENPDYLAKGFPRQSAQQAIKEVQRNMKGWINSLKDWKQHPEKYTGKPKLPHYHKSGGMCTAIITNQDGVLKKDKQKRTVLKLPKTKLTILCKDLDDEYTLKEVQIKPVHDEFNIILVLEKPDSVPEPKEPHRICTIDLGVRNFAAITNNAGLPCILFKGGVVNSINQWTAKKMASIQSLQTAGTTEHFVMTKEAHQLLAIRSNKLEDYLHKTAKYIIRWCLANEIDTIVIGANYFWKQNSNMGKVQNQKYCMVPHTRFRQILKYLCEREGINYIEQEESYTSKADFTARDFMPVYGKEPEEFKFSGKRSPITYKDHSRSSGFHGLYVTKTGAIINSDLNGSANIGRKAFPDMFDRIDTYSPDFQNVLVIKHPEQSRISKNKKNQLASRPKEISHSKQKRLNKKKTNVIPMG